ncbi:MAG TPA: amino acid adenylation domain-containing protein, partial [Longimicrobiaceae bacterium]|nr:amino acid adenylation domain-containing protein [Longimicrobiaceae bacterium]
LLARYSGQEDVVVGSPIAGRSWRETEDLIGFFVNMLCLRSELAGDLTWAELLGRVRVMALEAYAHQDLPFERLVEELAVERSTTHSPIFQVVFALSRSAGQDGLVLDEVGATRFGGGDRVIKFDLDLTFQDAGATLTGTLTYRAALFEAQTVTRMAAHLETLLEAMVADPARRLSDVSLLRAAERARLLEEWNPAPAEHPYAPVHELFAGQAARRPDAVAVVFGEESLAYAELDRRADLLAHHLASLGVRRNHRVGICVQRGLEMVVGILGVLKAGAAYVPLDPALPPERLAFMLADAAVPALLTQERLLDRLPEHAAAVVCLDRDWSVIEQRSPGAPRVEVGPEDLFCVIYTSGSTGEPKGTEVPHRAVPGFFRGADYARFDEEHTLLQYSSVSWDALTLELWPALLTGGRTVLYPGDGADLEGLEQEVEARGVTTLWMTAALFNLAVDTRPSLLRRLSQAIIGGEALSPAHVRRALEEAPALRLANGYGPSECTVFTACQVLTPEVAARPSIPIGRPVGDRRVYVLDRVLSPVPAGLPGELLVGGPAVPVGYLGRPEQTAEKLVPDPFGAPGARLYRTGDRVRWTASGELEFLGRMDRQVKVRGFRIEVEEIEAALTGHPRVREAAVSVWEHGEEKRLVGYVVPDDGGGAPAAELRGWLRERMPEYMVPSAFVMLERLPLTRNGKVDRRALPVPERSGSARNGAHLRPRDPLESTLAGIFEEVLDVTGVGLDDSFFDLGGHSLLAVRLMSRLQDAMGVRLPAAALFRAPTVERLAEEVRVGSGGETPLLVPIRTGGCRTPLFLVHPGGGGLLGYAALVGRLGDDQPVYGLRSRGVEPGEKPTLTIEEMARHYLAAVREVRPSGPYRLGGWSLGGVIAFEMARQLEASGEEVERLVLIDSQVPWLLQQRRAAPPEGSLLVQMFAQDAGLAAEPLPPPGPEARGAGEATYLRCLLETARAGGQIPGDLDLVRMQHLYGVFRTNVQALYGYCPEVYTGPVTLLRASNGEPNERHPGKSNGWERVARGVEVRQVPGTHYT